MKESGIDEHLDYRGRGVEWSLRRDHENYVPSKWEGVGSFSDDLRSGLKQSRSVGRIAISHDPGSARRGA